MTVMKNETMNTGGQERDSSPDHGGWVGPAALRRRDLRQVFSLKSQSTGNAQRFQIKFNQNTSIKIFWEMAYMFLIYLEKCELFMPNYIISFKN